MTYVGMVVMTEFMSSAFPALFMTFAFELRNLS